MDFARFQFARSASCGQRRSVRPCYGRKPATTACPGIASVQKQGRMEKEPLNHRRAGYGDSTRGPLCPGCTDRKAALSKRGRYEELGSFQRASHQRRADFCGRSQFTPLLLWPQRRKEIASATNITTFWSYPE